jgi:hypothetical protein
MALQPCRKIADLPLFQPVLAIHFVRNPDTHRKRFLWRKQIQNHILQNKREQQAGNIIQSLQ